MGLAQTRARGPPYSPRLDRPEFDRILPVRRFILVVRGGSRSRGENGRCTTITRILRGDYGRVNGDDGHVRDDYQTPKQVLVAGRRRVSGARMSRGPYLRGRTTQHDTVRAAVAIGQ